MYNTFTPTIDNQCDKIKSIFHSRAAAISVTHCPPGAKKVAVLHRQCKLQAKNEKVVNCKKFENVGNTGPLITHFLQPF